MKIRASVTAGGLQPRRQDRPDRECGQHGAALGRGHGQAVGQTLPHQGPVRAVAFSPDGKTVLTGSDDKTARLWVAADGQPLVQPCRIWLGPAVAFSPDGKTVLTGRRKLRESGRGRQPQVRRGVDGRNSAVASTPEARPCRGRSAPTAMDAILTAAARPYVRIGRRRGEHPDKGQAGLDTGLWEASTGKLRRNLPHQGAVFAVAFSPDGKTILTGSAGKPAALGETRARASC